jgi:sugar O-acyltransferase (sialic acid O-acetyltransferase NeuD family)
MKAKRIIIIGAGGFAREVAWLIKEINQNSKAQAYEFLGYVVSDLSKVDPSERSNILGDHEWLKKNRSQWDALAIGIGNPERRCALPKELDALIPGIEWPALVHPRVRMDFQSTIIERGALLCANVIGTVNLKFEEFCLINLACTIGHEATIGAGSVINPSVNISGGVVIKEGVLVGTGAQILQYIQVNEGATVGAGAVVTKEVAARVTVAGIPAKPLNR